MFEKDTLSVTGGGDYGCFDPISPPIYQTSTFGGGAEYSYSRTSNPTRDALQNCLAELENGQSAFAFSSGLAAINAVLSLLKSGDRVLLSDDLYGGTYRIAVNIFSQYGIEFEFCDLQSTKEIEKRLCGARILLAETPTNPMMKVADLKRLASLCREKNVIFAVDNTFLTPIFQNPLSLGADIVIHSATKYLSGHHDTIAGAVVTSNEELAERLNAISNTLGNALSPFDCWLVLRGLRTLPLRMERHQENALAAAEFLKAHPKIGRVIYPGLKEHPGHSVCCAQASGFGGVVSFTVNDGSLIASLKRGGQIIKFAESLGGFRTLITYPLTQTHASVPKEMRERIGITSGLFRLSLGLENKRDILADLENILSRSN